MQKEDVTSFDSSMSQCWILVTDDTADALQGGKSLKGHSFQHSLLPIFQDCYIKADLGDARGQ